MQDNSMLDDSNNSSNRKTPCDRRRWTKSRERRNSKWKSRKDEAENGRASNADKNNTNGDNNAGMAKKNNDTITNDDTASKVRMASNRIKLVKDEKFSVENRIDVDKNTLDNNVALESNTDLNNSSLGRADAVFDADNTN